MSSTTIIIVRKTDPIHYQAGSLFVHYMPHDAPAERAKWILENHLEKYPETDVMGSSKDPPIWAMIGHIAKSRGLRLHDLEGESCAVH